MKILLILVLFVVTSFISCTKSSKNFESETKPPIVENNKVLDNDLQSIEEAHQAYEEVCKENEMLRQSLKEAPHPQSVEELNQALKKDPNLLEESHKMLEKSIQVRDKLIQTGLTYEQTILNIVIKYQELAKMLNRSQEEPEWMKKVEIKINEIYPNLGIIVKDSIILSITPLKFIIMTNNYYRMVEAEKIADHQVKWWKEQQEEVKKK